METPLILASWLGGAPSKTVGHGNYDEFGPTNHPRQNSPCPLNLTLLGNDKPRKSTNPFHARKDACLPAK